jgi:hypothetical protein
MKTGRKGGPAGLPHPLEKREVLYSRGTDPAVLVQTGERFLAEGYPLDALNFFTEARSAEHLERMLAQAREEGDAFLADQTARALGREIAPEQWAEIAGRAEELGKHAFARTARRRAGLEQAEASLPGTPKP